MAGKDCDEKMYSCDGTKWNVIYTDKCIGNGMGEQQEEQQNQQQQQKGNGKPNNGNGCNMASVNG